MLRLKIYRFFTAAVFVPWATNDSLSSNFFLSFFLWWKFFFCCVVMGATENDLSSLSGLTECFHSTFDSILKLSACMKFETWNSAPPTAAHIDFFVVSLWFHAWMKFCAEKFSVCLYNRKIEMLASLRAKKFDVNQKHFHVIFFYAAHAHPPRARWLNLSTFRFYPDCKCQVALSFFTSLSSILPRMSPLFFFLFLTISNFIQWTVNIIKTKCRVAEMYSKVLNVADIIIARACRDLNHLVTHNSQRSNVQISNFKFMSTAWQSPSDAEHT